MNYRGQSNHQSVSSYSHSRRRPSNRSLSSQSQSQASSQESTGGGKIRPLLGRQTRLQTSRSAACVGLRLNGEAATQRRRRSNFGSGSTDRLFSATRHTHAARHFDLQASSRNADWNDIPIAPPPLTCAVKDTGTKKNLFAELVGLKVTPEAFASKLPTKSVHFSTDKDYMIEYEVSPQDPRNYWHTTDISRTLENLDSIYYHRGLKVSYPRSVYKGQECMVRIEPPAVIDEIIRIKEKHLEAVLKEQARQVDSSKPDADALAKVALAHSERGVEIASSTWWLERMNYRD